MSPAVKAHTFQKKRYGAQTSSVCTRHALVAAYHPVFKWAKLLGFTEQCDSTGKPRSLSGGELVKLSNQPPKLVRLSAVPAFFSPDYSAYLNYPSPSEVNRDEYAAALQHRVRALLGKAEVGLTTSRDVYLDALALVGLLKVCVFPALFAFSHTHTRFT